MFRFAQSCGILNRTNPPGAVNSERVLTTTLDLARQPLMQVLYCIRRPSTFGRTHQTESPATTEPKVQPVRIRAGVLAYPRLEVMPY